MRKKYDVTLYRKGGRFFKNYVARSKYAAKKIKLEWEEKYDHTYFVEIHEIQQ